MTIIPRKIVRDIDIILTPQEAKRRLKTCEMGLHAHEALRRISECQKPQSFLETYQRVRAEEEKRFTKSVEGG